MISPIAILERRNINVNNSIKAVQDAKALNWRAPQQFREGIKELIGNELMEDSQINDKSVHYLYYYLVQNIVKQNELGQKLDLDVVISKSLNDTSKIMARVHGGDLSCILLLEEYNINENIVNTNSDGTVKPNKKRGKKGNKKGLAMAIYKENKDTLPRSQIVDMFVKNLGMSKACAQTYFSILKKELK